MLHMAVISHIAQQKSLSHLHSNMQRGAWVKDEGVFQPTHFFPSLFSPLPRAPVQTGPVKTLQNLLVQSNAQAKTYTGASCG